MTSKSKFWKKIFIVSVICILAILLIFSILLSLEKNIQSKLSVGNAQQIAIETASELELSLENCLERFEIISSLCSNGKNIWDKDVSPTVQTIMNKTNDHNIKYIDSLFNKYSIDGTLDGNLEIENKNYLNSCKEIFDGTKQSEIIYNYDSDTGQPKVRFLIPVFDGDNVRGILSITVEHTEFEECIIKTYNDVSLFCAITDSFGNIILQNQTDYLSADLNSVLAYGEISSLSNEKKAEIYDAIADNQEFSLKYKTTEKYNNIIVIEPLSRVNWALVMIVPENYFSNNYGKLFIEAAVIELTIIVVLLSLFCVSLLLYINLRMTYVAKIRAEKNLQRAHSKLMAAEMKPHFLFNTLSAIREVVISDPEYASELIVNFSEILRAQIIALEDDHMITYAQEMNTIRSYEKIEKLRHGDTFILVYQTEAEDFYIPALSIEPIVENAILHGNDRGKKNDYLTICLKSEETSMHFIITVKDNGSGFNVDQTLNMIDTDNQAGHYGMKNYISRLREKLNAEVCIQSSCEGTCVTVKIPKSN